VKGRVLAMAKKLGFGDLPSYPSIVLGIVRYRRCSSREASSSIIASDAWT